MEGPAEVLVEAVVDDGVAARVEVGAPQEEAAQPRRVVHERRQLQEGREMIHSRQDNLIRQKCIYTQLLDPAKEGGNGSRNEA